MQLTGAVHVAAAVLSLGVAAFVLLTAKGTTTHVRAGRVYVVLLLALNAAALLTRDETGGYGPFHLLALVSLATLLGGVVLSPRRRGSRLPHSIFMVWSVTGLVAAGLAQAAAAALPESEPWPVVLTSAAACAVALAVTRTMRLAGPTGQ